MIDPRHLPPSAQTCRVERQPTRRGFGASIAAILGLIAVVGPWLALAFGGHRSWLTVVTWGAVVALVPSYLVGTVLGAAGYGRAQRAGVRSLGKLVIATWVFFVASASALLGSFAETYYSFWGSTTDFTPHLGRLSAAYFTFGTFTTAGSGITVTGRAQLVVIVQMIVDTLLVVVILGFLVANLPKRAVRRNRAGAYRGSNT